MAKPPFPKEYRSSQTKKREPTIRELLELDAKNPLREIGLTDDFNNTQVQNTVNNVSDEIAKNTALEAAREYIRKRREDDMKWKDPQKFVSSLDGPQKKTPLALSSTNLLYEILTGASPAGERADTERARVADWNARTNSGRNTPDEVYGMTALRGNATYPHQSKISKLMGVTNKKASK